MRGSAVSTGRKTTALVLTCTLLIATCLTEASAFPASPQQGPAPSGDRLEQLVAPIALYPDALVAQILAGATFPTQIVEADRWLQQNSKLQGEDLASSRSATLG
jgi:hypothetical protein